MKMKPPREEYMDLALACGAELTGKPDGSEPIGLRFSIKAWVEFDAANQEVATEAAKATGTAGEPNWPELPSLIFGMVDGAVIQLPKAHAVKLLREYGKQCAEAARQPAPALPVKTWQERLKEGGWEDYTAMLAEIADLRAAMAATAAPVLTSAKINEIYQRTHKHCYDGAAAGNFLREYIAATNRSQP